MKLLRRAWHLLRLSEKVLLGLSLLVIACCAVVSRRSSERQERHHLVLQEPTNAASIKWQDDGILVVDVAGAVRHPGIYKMPSGSRVQDALHRAGGILSDATVRDLNLAAPLQDGQQVRVTAQTTKSTFAENAFDDNRIDINHASAEELQQLPGVGPVLAQRILDYRSTNGGFHSLEELDDVKGIGRKRLEEWRSLIIFR